MSLLLLSCDYLNSSRQRSNALRGMETEGVKILLSHECIVSTEVQRPEGYGNVYSRAVNATRMDKSTEVQRPEGYGNVTSR